MNIHSFHNNLAVSHLQIWKIGFICL